MPSTDADDVRAYYASFHEREWQRLESGEGRIEWRVTVDALARHLRPGSRVLDLGGGPGRYAIWLARQGHRVTLVDLAPNLLEIARHEVELAGVGDAIEEIREGDARDLSRYAGQAFDAVICLGPFYHLVDAAEREAAAAEIARVVRPGGVAFVALMPRFGFIRRTIARPDERRHLTDSGFVESLMNDGVFRNDVMGRFNPGYGVRPEDVGPFFAAHGLHMVEMLSDVGLAANMASELAGLEAADPAAHEAALQLIVRSAGDPSLWGAANHLIYVGRRTVPDEARPGIIEA